MLSSSKSPEVEPAQQHAREQHEPMVPSAAVMPPPPPELRQALADEDLLQIYDEARGAHADETRGTSNALKVRTTRSSSGRRASRPKRERKLDPVRSYSELLS